MGNLSNIRCICTSIASLKIAKQANIPLSDTSLSEEIDITFDGADRINSSFQLIKGGGGALLREKLVALQSKRNVVLVDYTKISTPLSGFPVPIEIVEFGHLSTINRLKKLGYEGSLRKYPSDNGNLLFDLTIEPHIEHPIELHEQLKKITGVIETGIFFDTSELALVGYQDLTVRRMNKL